MSNANSSNSLESILAGLSATAPIANSQIGANPNSQQVPNSTNRPLAPRETNQFVPTPVGAPNFVPNIQSNSQVASVPVMARPPQNTQPPVQNVQNTQPSTVRPSTGPSVASSSSNDTRPAVAASSSNAPKSSYNLGTAFYFLYSQLPEVQKKPVNRIANEFRMTVFPGYVSQLFDQKLKQDPIITDLTRELTVNTLSEKIENNSLIGSIKLGSNVTKEYLEGLNTQTLDGVKTELTKLVVDDINRVTQGIISAYSGRENDVRLAIDIVNQYAAEEDKKVLIENAPVLYSKIRGVFPPERPEAKALFKTIAREFVDTKKRGINTIFETQKKEAIQKNIGVLNEYFSVIMEALPIGAFGEFKERKNDVKVFVRDNMEQLYPFFKNFSEIPKDAYLDIPFPDWRITGDVATENQVENLKKVMPQILEKFIKHEQDVQRPKKRKSAPSNVASNSNNLLTIGDLVEQDVQRPKKRRIGGSQELQLQDSQMPESQPIEDSQMQESQNSQVESQPQYSFAPIVPNVSQLVEEMRNLLIKSGQSNEVIQRTVQALILGSTDPNSNAPQAPSRPVSSTRPIVLGRPSASNIPRSRLVTETDPRIQSTLDNAQPVQPVQRPRPTPIIRFSTTPQAQVQNVEETPANTSMNQAKQRSLDTLTRSIASARTVIQSEQKMIRNNPNDEQFQIFKLLSIGFYEQLVYNYSLMKQLISQGLDPRFTIRTELYASLNERNKQLLLEIESLRAQTLSYVNSI